MKAIWRHFKLVFPFLAALGCSPDPQARLSDAAMEASSRPDRRFRNLFASYLQNEGRAGELERLVFLSPEATLHEQGGASLENLAKQFSDWKPSHLFELGKQESVAPLPRPDSVFERTGPITIVLLPGIFGEFINNRPFEETLARGGAFRRRWESALARRTARAFSLETLSLEPLPLSEVANLASLDGPDGSPLVNLIYLRPPLGSLETLGTLEANAAVYLERLGQIFSIIPELATPNVFLMGYSRGLPVALEVLTKALERPSQHPWAPRVRGVVGLGGAFYGAGLADDVRTNPHSWNARIFGVAEKLGLELTLDEQSTENPLERFWDALRHHVQVPAANATLWAQSAFTMAQLLQEMDVPPGLAIESQHTAGIRVKVSPLTEMLFHAAFGVFKLQHPLGDHYRNVEKFKVLVRKVGEGVDTLTTRDRLAWWRTHTVPEHVRLYSIAGSMADATTAQGEISPLWRFPAFGSGMADVQLILRRSFYDVTRVHGTELNDSQVALWSARYWPGLASTLNPAQSPLHHEFLGVLGTHHWGFAFPSALEESDGDPNPFPREVLLKTLGASLALSLQ